MKGDFIGAIVGKFISSSQDCDMRVGKQVRELCMMRDRSQFEEQFLDRSDINQILINICTE